MTEPLQAQYDDYTKEDGDLPLQQDHWASGKKGEIRIALALNENWVARNPELVSPACPGSL